MLTYDAFVKDYSHQIDAAYQQAHGHGPATSDQFHVAWRLLREGWDIDAVLADIHGQPYTQGPGAHSEEMLGAVPPLPIESGFLHIDGPNFRTEDGAPWVFAGYHAHLWLPLMATGQDIRPRLQEARSYGANTVIVIGCHLSSWKHDHGFAYDPRDPSHPDRLAALFDTCAQEHMRICYKALADADGVDEGTQRAIWQQAGNIARGRWNVLLSIGNEGPVNGWRPEAFSRLDVGGVLQSKGDKGGDEVPYLEPWDFAEYESPRGLPHALTDANAIELYYGGWDANPQGIRSVPIVTIEPAFFHDDPIDKWGDRRWNDPSLALALGRSIGSGCAGGGFGASDGMEGLPLQPRAADCARAFYRGLRGAFVR